MNLSIQDELQPFVEELQQYAKTEFLEERARKIGFIKRKLQFFRFKFISHLECSFIRAPYNKTLYIIRFIVIYLLSPHSKKDQNSLKKQDVENPLSLLPKDIQSALFAKSSVKSSVNYTSLIV